MISSGFISASLTLNRSHLQVLEHAFHEAKGWNRLRCYLPKQFTLGGPSRLLAMMSPFMTQRTKSKFMFAGPYRIGDTLFNAMPISNISRDHNIAMLINRQSLFAMGAESDSIPETKCPATRQMK
ncbi:hypothetical protein Dimus_000311 [Dionaea muscipula]